MDIRVWLRDLGLERYEPAFRDNDVDPEILTRLTADDLLAIGVTSVGHRRKLLEAIAALSATQPSGTPTAGDSEAAKPRTAEAERRQLTVLFCDLVGSTALAARLDPEDLGRVIRAYQDTCAAVVERWGGHIAKYMGDGVLAYFGWPRAHEDDAERAVRTALELAGAIGGLTADGGTSLAVRIGIATGQVVVGELIGEGAAQEQAVVGETPNLAARLQALAAPGQVVIAGGTRRLLGVRFELEDLGARELKGIGAPAQAFAVTGERPVESRFDTTSGPSLLPMIGRDQELALLLERWAQARSGEGQGVLLVGEAGIGKSRIARAVLDALAEEPHLRIRYQCSPYHVDSALWPVVQQLRRAAGLQADDAPGQALDKLEQLLGHAVGDSTPAAIVIADLLGLDGVARYGKLGLTPQVQRARTLEALVEQLLGLATKQPVLVVLEDAHWIDPTTLELIEKCLDRIAAAPVLIILTTRPDNQPSLATHPHVTRLTLNRLGRVGVETIVVRLGGEHLPAETIETIIARTDGVPLFVEELTKAVLETGEATVPASLHDSLMARLDRLLEVRAIAQIAACIGREFDYPLLAAVADRPLVALGAGLDKLAAAELIFRRGSPPDARYTFKHALVRDAAYESLLRQRRRQVHARIAATLLQNRSQTGSVPDDLVATHLLKAERLREALPHLLAAAKTAANRLAYAEAVVWLERGRSIIARLDADPDVLRLEMELYLILTPILMAVKGFRDSETLAAAERADTLCQEFAEYDRLVPVLFGQLSFHSAGQELVPALELAHRIRKIGSSRDHIIAKVVGYRAEGFCLLWMGKLAEAEDALVTALDHARLLDEDGLARQFGIGPRTTGLSLLGSVRHRRGFLSEGRALLEDADKQAEALRHPLTRAYVLRHHSVFAADEVDLSEVERLSEQARVVCERFDIRQWELLTCFMSAWAHSRRSGPNADVGRLEALLEEHSHRDFRLNSSFYLLLLADVMQKSGLRAEAGRRIEEALQIMDRTSERWVEPDALRLKAALSSGREGEADVLLQQSLRLARQQGARVAELRAARDLAQRWAERRRRAEAHDLLAPIYDWFTEGFETPDLKDAKALLDELA